MQEVLQTFDGDSHNNYNKGIEHITELPYVKESIISREKFIISGLFQPRENNEEFDRNFESTLTFSSIEEANYFMENRVDKTKIESYEVKVKKVSY